MFPICPSPLSWAKNLGVLRGPTRNVPERVPDTIRSFREGIGNPRLVMDLLMGLFRGAVFHHDGVPENCPLASMGRCPSLMGRFATLMGRFPECLNGPFSLLKIPWKTAPLRKGALRVSWVRGNLLVYLLSRRHCDLKRCDFSGATRERGQCASRGCMPKLSVSSCDLQFGIAI